MQKPVSINRLKTTSLHRNLEEVTSLKSKSDALSGL